MVLSHVSLFATEPLSKKRKKDDEDGDTDDESDDDEDEEDEESENIVGGKAQGKRAVPGKKGKVTWRVKEVEKFLELCYEKHVMAKIDGVAGNNLSRVQIFTPVAAALNQAKLGTCTKTPKDCKAKFGRLKKSYRRTMRLNGKSGEGKTTCKFFPLLHKLLHNRPNVTAQEWGHQSGAGPKPRTTSCSKSVVDGDGDTTADESSPAPPLKSNLPKYRSGLGGEATFLLSVLFSLRCRYFSNSLLFLTAGRASTASHVEAWRKQDAEEQEQQRKWEAEQADANRQFWAQHAAEMQQRDQTMMENMAKTMSTVMSDTLVNSFKAIGGIFTGQMGPFSQPQYPNFMAPPPASNFTQPAEPPQVQYSQRPQARPSAPIQTAPVILNRPPNPQEQRPQAPQFRPRVQIIHQMPRVRPGPHIIIRPQTGTGTASGPRIRLPLNAIQNNKLDMPSSNQKTE